LVGFVKSGELAVEKVVDPEKIKAILQTMEKTGASSASFLKNAMGENYSYNEIRAVVYSRQAANAAD
jgi:hypothetical protein